jgi:hypothetical protein
MRPDTAAEPLSSPAIPTGAEEGRTGGRRRLFGILRFLWKWLLGAASCQAFPLAVIGAGWCTQAARRAALKAWWKRGHPPSEKTSLAFRRFTREHEAYRNYERYPNWILQSGYFQSFPALPLAVKGTGLVHSLASHVWLGSRAWFHSLVFLAIPSGLMMFSWFSGWDNSFNKGYEQFSVGAILGWVGITLFVAVMFYLPMAQARFAVTQRSRDFYAFRVVRRVIRRQWLSTLGLVAGYALAGLPLMLAGSFLGLATASQDGNSPNPLGELTPQEALSFLQAYYFWWGWYVFAAFLLLRCWAARIYAKGVQACVRTERLALTDLDTWERQAMETCRVAEATSPPKRRVLWLGNTTARLLLGGTAALILWFSLAAQTYVTQFFAFQPEVRRWVNHPLIQVPWFSHIPGHLKDADESF